MSISPHYRPLSAQIPPRHAEFRMYRRRIVLSLLAAVFVGVSTACGTPTRPSSGLAAAPATTPTLPSTQTMYMPRVEQHFNLPDLVAASMSISLDTNCLSQTSRMGLRVTVANSGDSDVGSFVVEANGVQQTVSGGLAAGQSTTLWFAGYRYGTPNTIIVDPAGLIDEYDETNNQLSQMVPVPTPPRPCPTPTPTASPTPSPTL
jgi:hypothetical protein